MARSKKNQGFIIIGAAAAALLLLGGKSSAAEKSGGKDKDKDPNLDYCLNIPNGSAKGVDPVTGKCTGVVCDPGYEFDPIKNACVKKKDPRLDYCLNLDNGKATGVNPDTGICTGVVCNPGYVFDPIKNACVLASKPTPSPTPRPTPSPSPTPGKIGTISPTVSKLAEIMEIFKTIAGNGTYYQMNPSGVSDFQKDWNIVVDWVGTVPFGDDPNADKVINTGLSTIVLPVEGDALEWPTHLAPTSKTSHPMQGRFWTTSTILR